MAENPHRTEDHPLSENQTNTDDHKGTTTLAAVLDSSFPLPTLTSESTPLQYFLSFATLFALLALGVGGAIYVGVEILQSSRPFFMAGTGIALLMGAFFITGTIWIDWYGLVVKYWWLSMPIGALAGIAVVLNIEASTGIADTE